jgi:hypothetical protein
MAMRDHATFNIYDVLGKAKFVEDGNSDCAEGLVDLDPLDPRFRG